MNFSCPRIPREEVQLFSDATKISRQENMVCLIQQKLKALNISGLTVVDRAISLYE